MRLKDKKKEDLIDIIGGLRGANSHWKNKNIKLSAALIIIKKQIDRMATTDVCVSKATLTRLSDSIKVTRDKKTIKYG